MITLHTTAQQHWETTRANVFVFNLSENQNLPSTSYSSWWIPLYTNSLHNKDSFKNAKRLVVGGQAPTTMDGTIQQMRVEGKKKKYVAWTVCASYRSLEEYGSERVSHSHRHDRYSCPCGSLSPWWCTMSHHPQSPIRQKQKKTVNGLEKNTCNLEAAEMVEGI